MHILYVCTVNVSVVISVPDSINYDLQAVEISEDCFQISWKVSSEMLLMVGWLGMCVLWAYISNVYYLS